MANDTLRADMVEQVREEQGRSKMTRAPRPARPPRDRAEPSTTIDNAAAEAQPATTQGEGDASNEAGESSDAPRKRRRRRRPVGARPSGEPDNPPVQ